MASETVEPVSEIRRCFELVQQGEYEIKLEPKEAVLLLGVRGSDTATLVRCLTHDDKLAATEADDTKGVAFGANSTFVPANPYPKLFVDPPSNTSYYDCHGFDDNPEAAFDVAKTYFVRKIAKNTKKLKILLTVDYTSIRSGAERRYFGILVERTLSFLTNFEKYSRSVALIVTRVDDSTTTEGKRAALAPVTDEVITKNVVQFLEAFKQNVEKVVAGAQAASVKKFVDVLLARKHERIALVRSPKEPGPREWSPNAVASVRKMVEDMAYAAAGEEDFGYTTSDRWKNDVNEAIDRIDRSVSGYANEVGGAIRKRYEAAETECTDVYGLRGQLNNVHEKLQNLLDIARKPVGVTRFTKELLELAREFRANAPKERVLGVLRQDKYLEFLKEVGRKTDDTSSLMWKVGLRSTMEYVADSRKWYNFAVALHQRLSSYRVQKRKGEFQYMLRKDVEDVHEARLRQFMSGEADGLGYDEILKLRADPVKLDILNRIFRSTLSSNVRSQYDEHTGTYDVRGDYVLTSGLDGERLRKAKFVNVFAADTIFLDENLLLDGVQRVSMMAPTWEVVGRRSVTLDGRDACCAPSSRAADGLAAGAAGQNGAPGLPGASAGNFFGVGARFVNARNLTILANGGRGGAGQDGGRGARGHDGASPRDGADRVHFRTEKIGNGFLGAKKTYCLYGEDGGNGGDGGDGGDGGEGGDAGDVRLSTVGEYANIVVETKKGANGEGGAGGEGGGAGQRGGAIQAQKVFGKWKSAGASDKCSQRDTSRDGLAGNVGRRGGNTAGKRKPAVVATGRLAKVVNEYKEFMRESLPAESVKRRMRTEMLDALDEGTSIADLYESVDFVEEFLGLENQYASLKGYVDFAPIYQRLLRRVEGYAARAAGERKSTECKRALSTLYAAVLSKVCATKEIPRDKLVVDPRKYLQSADDLIKEDKFTTEEYREGYATEIKNAIDEALSFLAKYVVAEIDATSKVAQEKVEVLVRELVGGQNAGGPQAEVLRANLQHHLVTLKILEAPKLMARLLNAAAVQAQEMMSTKASVNGHLVLENVSPEGGFATSSSNVNETFRQNTSESELGVNKVLLDTSMRSYNSKLENMDDQKLEALISANVCDVGPENCATIAGADERTRILAGAMDGASVPLTLAQFYVDELVDRITGLVRNAGDEKRRKTGQILKAADLVDVKVTLQGVRRAFVLPEGVDGCFGRLERATNALTNVYEHVEHYQTLDTLAAYLKNVDPRNERKTWASTGSLKNVLGILNAIIDWNVLTAAYHQTITTLKRSIFPFADSYAPTFDLDVPPQTTNLKSVILDKVRSVNSLFEKTGTFVGGQVDRYVYEGDFKSLGAFYTWTNEEYGNTVTALLNGEEVILRADVTRGVSKHAVKFNSVRVKFRASDGAVQRQLDDDLRAFQVRLTYLGDSAYRCGNHFYSFAFENLPLVFSMATNEKDEPRYTNKVYERIKNGEYVLSPYASWSVQLTGSDVGTLRRYARLVDVQLEGHGQFIENATLCDGAPKNYKVDETIFEDIVAAESKLNLRDVGSRLPTGNQKHPRNRRSTEIKGSSGKSFGEADAGASSNPNGMVNRFFDGVSKMLTANFSSSSGASSRLISFNDPGHSSLVTPQTQFDINNGLILTDLLIRKLTKATPNYFQGCAVQFENVRACALDIINEFENILDSMSAYDGEFDFDPVPLMSKLEAEIINGDRREFGKILLNAVEDKSGFDEEDFNHRLKLLPGYETN